MHKAFHVSLSKSYKPNPLYFLSDEDSILVTQGILDGITANLGYEGGKNGAIEQFRKS